MKKIWFNLLIAGVIALSLSGCGQGRNKAVAPVEDATITEITESAEAAEPTEILVEPNSVDSIVVMFTNAGSVNRRSRITTKDIESLAELFSRAVYDKDLNEGRRVIMGGLPDCKIVVSYKGKPVAMNDWMSIWWVRGGYVKLRQTWFHLPADIQASIGVLLGKYNE